MSTSDFHTKQCSRKKRDRKKTSKKKRKHKHHDHDEEQDKNEKSESRQGRLFLPNQTNCHWYTRQIDFVLAFPQADVECDIFMELPRGLVFEGVDRSTNCVKLIKNFYGQKQAGPVWNDYLVKGLKDWGFFQTKVDECVFYKGKTILLVYVGDAILCGPRSKVIDDIIASLKEGFDVTDEGEIDDYLGVKVTQPTKDTIELRQPHLIQQILDEVGMLPQSKMKDKAALSSTILCWDLDGSTFQEKWDYRHIIGKLSFLDESTRPEMAYAVHQSLRYSSVGRLRVRYWDV
jgi:hypothetical protein